MFGKDFDTKDFILFQNHHAIGVLAPSTLYGVDGDLGYFWGPKGVFRFNVRAGIKAAISALRESGSLIEGSDESIRAVNQLLLDSQTSRTTSYFLCTDMRCDEIEKSMQCIRSAHVLVVGCGGIGSSVAMLLAGAGVKKLTIIDGDTIEASNLNRQLFWTKSDIGSLKVSTLEKRIAERFDGCSVEAISSKISVQTIYEKGRDCNGIAITADEPITLVSESPAIARALGIPVVSSGYMHSEAMAFCFSGKTEFELKNMSDSNFWKRFPTSIMPSYGPTNMALAAAIASSLIDAIARNSWDDISSTSMKWNTAKMPPKFIVETLS